MANISVYKLQLINDSRDAVTLFYPLQDRKKVEDIIDKFEAHNICIKDNNQIYLPNGSILTNSKEIIDYYLNPGVKKPKNINEIDNILTNRKTLSTGKTDNISPSKKTLSSKNTTFEWINL